MSVASHWPSNEAETVARALAVEGGHLGIGHGGYTLHYARGVTLSGYDVGGMKAGCIAAGLPVGHWISVASWIWSTAGR